MRIFKINFTIYRKSMPEFKAILEKFHQKGEKSGWTYIEIPNDISEAINPGVKKSFRVKGKIDDFAFKWVSTVPMGEGEFIIAINAEMRKTIQKSVGEAVVVELEKDSDEKPLNEQLLICLEDDAEALQFFNTLPKGHQRYFSNWIESAKTEATQTKRIAQAVSALSMRLEFGPMIRRQKKEKMG